MDKKSFKKVVTLRIAEELIEKIDEAAKKQYRSRTDFIIQAILKEINEKGDD